MGSPEVITQQRPSRADKWTKYAEVPKRKPNRHATNPDALVTSRLNEKTNNLVSLVFLEPNPMRQRIAANFPGGRG